MKLQQYTGPVQAKGLEDTAFYRYNVLLSLNEVGGDPSRFGRSVAGVPRREPRRARDWPFEMLATATHDTKLGEDVRARINVLSEMPDEWAREVSRWMRINRDAAERRRWRAGAGPRRRVPLLPGARRHVAGGPVTECASSASRTGRAAAAYMIKSVKEAKVHTSWLTPNEAYENAVTTFVERVLTGPGAVPRGVPAVSAAHRARSGMVNRSRRSS